MQVGFSQPVELSWMEAAARYASSGSSASEARVGLGELLAHKIAVNSSSKRSSRGKRVTILMTTWVLPRRDLLEFRDHALRVLNLSTGNDRILVHYAMLIATYPFFSTVAEHIGRLLRLQDQCSIEQLKRRSREDLGQRDTVSYAVTRVIRTLVDWDLLTKSATKGNYASGKSILVSSSQMIELLAEASLIASREQSKLVETVMTSPLLFPCKFADHVQGYLSASRKLSSSVSQYGSATLAINRLK